MARMTPQSLRMTEQLDRQGAVQTERERLDNRQHAQWSLTDTCTIQTRAVVADGLGGQTETWTNTYLTVPCRLMLNRQAFIGDEQVFAGRLIHQADYLLVVAFGQALTVTDRITAVDGPDGTIKDNGPFEVLAVGKALSDRASTQALLRRVQ